MTDTLSAQDIAPKARGQWSKILIMATIVVPMVVAYVVYQTGFGMPAGTINKGELLVPPVQITELALTNSEGAINFASEQKKWRLLVPAFGHCTGACEQSLYLTRQVHKRLNEKYPRVERWVLTDIAKPAFTDLLAAEYPGAKVINTDKAAWASLLATTNQPNGHYYMMDQNGFIMMAYNTELHTGNDLLKDVKRMLKFTREH
ncbi:hypothetical protein L1F30_17340 [Simiduia sp. 21SJ11W-1]|uniref:hypothetical protein n=1 Tax=Simiduia sp. 21SJ11W-1 TaxID=2909669 RepID=UPI0020A13338|nr:hypothetical protein [Simiduia sp. 21SJ11W-1]UTA47905.1 hypothetical protein L1F30_17340 [Simiduia sp. 21SJ11W-1]